MELGGAVRNESTSMVYGFKSLDGRRIREDDLNPPPDVTVEHCREKYKW